jgi:hypothetical protein
MQRNHAWKQMGDYLGDDFNCDFCPPLPPTEKGCWPWPDYIPVIEIDDPLSQTPTGWNLQHQMVCGGAEWGYRSAGFIVYVQYPPKIGWDFFPPSFGEPEGEGPIVRWLEAQLNRLQCPECSHYKCTSCLQTCLCD